MTFAGARLWTALALVVTTARPYWAEAQEPPPEPTDAEAPGPRPGMWQLGAFWVTPKFRIGSIGLDTNVNYTPVDRTTDISASGGPGLEIALPLGRSGRFYTEGYLDYLYFVKTESQRRLTGSARGGVEFSGLRTSFRLEEYWGETFTRPTFEVNQRVQQWAEGTRLTLKRALFGRISLTGVLERRHDDTGDDADYLGTDLARTLTADTYTAGAGLDYSLTVKTSFVVEYEHRWYRYPFFELRDANTDRLWAGFRTDATALIAGHALVGKRWYRFLATPLETSGTVVDVDGMIKLGPKTRIGGSYRQDFPFSSLVTVGLNPLMTQKTYGARIEKDLARNVDLRLYANESHIETNDPVAVVVPGEGLVVRKRDDRYRVLGAELGYRFRPRFRVGVTASYGTQDTTIDYFGVEGLIVGATVRFNP